MKHVVHQSRAAHDLALLLALLFSLQPAGLFAPPVASAAAVTWPAQVLVPLVQGFWETVAMYAGR